MARTFGQGLSEFSDQLTKRRQLRADEEGRQLERLKTYGGLMKEGFDISEQQTPARRVFGIPIGQAKRQLVISRENIPAPEGYVRLPNGEYQKDETYYNPAREREKARIKSEEDARAFGYMSGTNIQGEQEQTLPALEELNPQMQGLLKGITNYEIDPTKAASIRNNQRQRLIQMAKYYDPSYDMTQFPARSSYRTDFAKGKIGQNIRSYNTAIQHLAKLNDATGKVPSNPVQFVEGIQRGYAKQIRGDSPEALGMQSEDAAITAVAGELANIFKNSGGTDQEIKSWMNAYNRNATTEAKKQFVKETVDLMQGRVNALSSDYERVMGKKAPEENFIFPESKKAIGEIYGETNTSGSEMVQMMSPEGEPMLIPSENVEKAKKRGFK